MSEPHSALYLTDARDLWWNGDFLALLAARAQLGSARRVLDVGAGHGHWTRTVARLVAPGAQVIGIEREPAWVDAAAGGPDVAERTLLFRQGDAERLPFPDGTEADGFDVVTCQTVLIHMADPTAVVREMVRTLKPGGRLLLAEPNNLAENLARLITAPDFDLDDVTAFFRLQALCEKGKHALGLGFNSLGQGLIGLVAGVDVDDVQVWNNDKVSSFARGVDHRARPELVDERRVFDDPRDGGALIWSRADTRRYFDAGGGEAEAFDPLWTSARRAWQRRIEALERGDVGANEGSVFYVLCARKRSTR